MTDKHKFELHPTAVAALTTARDEMRASADIHREAWEAAPGEWREGDTGADVDRWIDHLRTVADDIDHALDFATQP